MVIADAFKNLEQAHVADTSETVVAAAGTIFLVPVPVPVPVRITG